MKLYLHAMKLHFKSLLEYKVSFLLSFFLGSIAFCWANAKCLLVISLGLFNPHTVTT